MEAPLPNDESQRLAALRDYQILDTAAEQVYDDVTALVAHICQVPMATISFVDAARQWFKSKVGLTSSETPRDVAFCAHTILQVEPMIVRDATQDARFVDSTLVTDEPQIRFYAGFPLVDASGMALGSLCAIDRKPRELSPAQQSAMKALARQVIALLAFRKTSRQLAASLELVKTLQGLIPICSWCKRVRDDKGYWEEVEAYVQARTGADFTHGICPDCLSRELSKRTTPSGNVLEA